MNARHRRLTPQLEAVEPRALLSGGIAGVSAVDVPRTSGTTSFLHMDGTLRGRYHTTPTTPDMGTTYVIGGSGRVSGVGHARVTGELHGVGFIAAGQAQGDVLLSRAKGTISIHVVGPTQIGGSQGLPDHFQFTITGGTGKYRGVVDTGTAIFVGIPSHTAASRPGVGHGHFTLVLTSDPTPFPVTSTT